MPASVGSDKISIFPGSFDPLTRGHADIVRRALLVFDKVLIAILRNSQKAALFSLEERVELIRQEFADCEGRVEVHTFSGLLVDFARDHQARVIIRGLRAITDYEYEAQMALMNRNLCDEIETIFLMAREDTTFISSSVVKQVALLGGSVTKFVSPRVAEALRQKFQQKLGQ